MLHDQTLLDWLADAKPSAFEGIVYRATRRGLDPLMPSTSGGRWMPADTEPVLYTSLERDGALAEIVYHWNRLTPPPSKPVLVHTLNVSVRRTLVLSPTSFTELGITWPDTDSRQVSRTQAVGAAAAYLGFDSIRVPSARRENDNLIVVFTNHETGDGDLTLRGTETVDWRMWSEAQQGFGPAEDH
jgi:hypothetical protein